MLHNAENFDELIMEEVAKHRQPSRGLPSPYDLLDRAREEIDGIADEIRLNSGDLVDYKFG